MKPDAVHKHDIGASRSRFEIALERLDIGRNVFETVRILDISDDQGRTAGNECGDCN